jgi:uncharacterized damage-inducible protein DinB
MVAAQDYFTTIRQLAQYEIWCNSLALQAAASLEPAQLMQRFPFGFGTIHRTLYHTQNVMRYWTAHIAPKFIQPEDIDYRPQATLAELQEWNLQLSTAFLDAIDASHQQGVLAADRRIVQVFHLVTHGTHHRTQFITMLRLLGKDAPFEAGDFAGWQRVHRM